MGETEQASLYDAAVNFAGMKDMGYGFVLGRKRKEYHIQLRFPCESFFHLAGLQHLEDITYPSNNKERIFKEILDEHLKYETRIGVKSSCTTCMGFLLHTTCNKLLIK